MAHRQVLITAGVGCRSGCSAADILAAVRAAVSENGVSVGDVRALYSADFKADEPGLVTAAAELERPLRLLSSAELGAHSAAAITHSLVVAARFGLPSVAEAAALAGATELGGPGVEARLLSARRVVGGAACALARLELEE
jgi:cobalt-precorrin 5A hydrolase